MSENIIQEAGKQEIEKKTNDKLESSQKITEESTSQEEDTNQVQETGGYKDEDAGKFLSYIFDLTNNPTNRLGSFLTFVRLLPYYIFSYIIQLMGMLLIPKSFVMLFGKIFLPIGFGILIISLFLFSGVQVALPSIDNALFGVQFFPLLGWLVGIIFLGVFGYGYVQIMKHYQGQYSKTSLFGSMSGKYIFGIFAFFFIFLPLGKFYLGGGGDILSKLTVVSSNGFGYLIYFTYTFLLINLILMIYKKIIYLIFSILDKETGKIGGHLISLGIYLGIILLVNNFLEISLTSIG